MMTIIQFAENDSQSIARIWNRAAGTDWPLTADLLLKGAAAPMPTQTALRLVATNGEEAVGFLFTQVNRRDDGSLGGNIQIMAVDPDYQRRGIGAALLDEALAQMRTEGVTRVQIGGLYPRLFPGVPETMTATRAFFEARGWTFSPTIEVDLVGDVREYALSEYLIDKMRAESITLEPARTQDVSAVLALNQREFAGWAKSYEHVARLGDYADFMIARHPERGVVGSLIMTSPFSHPTRSETCWRLILGDDMGSMGEVGVAKSERGRGIGLALVAWGAAELRRRGAGKCIIGWTTLTDFYNKVGFAVWRRYVVSRRDLT